MIKEREVTNYIFQRVKVLDYRCLNKLSFWVFSPQPEIEVYLCLRKFITAHCPTWKI